MRVTAKFLTALMTSAVIVCGAGIGSAAWAAEKEAKQQQVSRAVQKPLKAAQDAINAKNFDEALARLKEAEAVSGKTPYDDFVIHQLYGSAYINTKQYPEAAKALEAAVNAGFYPPEDAQRITVTLAHLYYEIKNYDKAVEFGQRVLKTGGADEEMYTVVAQAYFLKEDYKGAVKFLNDYLDDQMKTGKTPKEQTLLLLQSSCAKQNDQACNEAALERLVAYYPKASYWQNILVNMLQQQGQTEKGLLQVYRLAWEVDALNPEHYTEYAQLAIENGSPGEAQNVLEKAFQKNVFTDARALDRNKRLLESAKQQAASDKATLDKIAADAAAAKTGNKDVGVGLAYLGYRQYDKAVQALSRGLSKPGVQNEADARLLLGIAEFNAGNKDGADQAFKAVKGDPKLERLANLWSLHLRQAPAPGRTASAGDTNRQ